MDVRASVDARPWGWALSFMKIIITSSEARAIVARNFDTVSENVVIEQPFRETVPQPQLIDAVKTIIHQSSLKPGQPYDMIGFIKAIRLLTGASLAEAKDIADKTYYSNKVKN